MLIGSGIKQSEFPKFMMPFFALIMVESRMAREARRLKEQIGEIDMDDFVEMFEVEGLGHNDFVIRKKNLSKRTTNLAKKTIRQYLVDSKEGIYLKDIAIGVRG